MICMLQSHPVSPPPEQGDPRANLSEDDSAVICQPCGEDEELLPSRHPVVDYGIDEDIDADLAMRHDPIVGVARVNANKHADGAILAKPLSSPPSMTAAAFEKHCLTHLPYHAGCPIRAATRKPNLQHRKPHEASRVLRLRAGD